MNVDRDYGQRSKLSKEENKIRATKRTEANRELQRHQLSGLCLDYDQEYNGNWFFDYYQPHRMDADVDEKHVDPAAHDEVYFIIHMCMCVFFSFFFFFFFSIIIIFVLNCIFHMICFNYVFFSFTFSFFFEIYNNIVPCLYS